MPLDDNLRAAKACFTLVMAKDENGVESILVDATANKIQQEIKQAKTTLAITQGLVDIINALSQAEFAKSETAKRAVRALDEYRERYELPAKFQDAELEDIKQALKYEIERVRDLHKLEVHGGVVKLCDGLLNNIVKAKKKEDCAGLLTAVRGKKYARYIKPIQQKFKSGTLLLGFEQKQLEVTYTLKTDLLRVVSRYQFGKRNIATGDSQTLAEELIDIINNSNSEDELRHSIKKKLNGVLNTKQNRTLDRLCNRVIAEYSSKQPRKISYAERRAFFRPFQPVFTKAEAKRKTAPVGKAVVTTQKIILGTDKQPDNIRHIRLMFHGLSDHSGTWNEAVDKMQNNREGAILTVAVDLPGLGLTPERMQANKLPVQTWCRLAPHIIAKLHEEHPDATISVDGHSLGGLIVSEIFPYLENFKTGADSKKIVTAARMFSPATVNTFFHPMLALLNRKKIEALPRVLKQQLEDPIFIGKNKLKFTLTSPQVSVSAHRVKARFLSLLSYKNRDALKTLLTIVLGKNDSAVDTDEHKQHIHQGKFTGTNAGHVTYKGALGVDPFNSDDISTDFLSNKICLPLGLSH
ncbi:MAG: alpha/beta fold hydrolase [Gammaproteobacteria bacterium]|nr:alpha/beta fold hydrolase [Gammaproteobacteria bacterium]